MHDVLQAVADDNSKFGQVIHVLLNYFIKSRVFIDLKTLLNNQKIQ